MSFEIFQSWRLHLFWSRTRVRKAVMLHLSSWSLNIPALPFSRSARFFSSSGGYTPSRRDQTGVGKLSQYDHSPPAPPAILCGDPHHGNRVCRFGECRHHTPGPAPPFPRWCTGTSRLLATRPSICVLILYPQFFFLVGDSWLQCPTLRESCSWQWSPSTGPRLPRLPRPPLPVQVLKSRFVLLGVATTAVLLVALSAAVLNTFPEGGTTFRHLLCSFLCFHQSCRMLKLAKFEMDFYQSPGFRSSPLRCGFS